jgi:hypothetical protein
MLAAPAMVCVVNVREVAATGMACPRTPHAQVLALSYDKLGLCLTSLWLSQSIPDSLRYLYIHWCTSYPVPLTLTTISDASNHIRTLSSHICSLSHRLMLFIHCPDAQERA